mmetsp:Transcript_40466/g.84518  ORF Transcript_40466/g.84518 Transcript_40466/m.84518 type:complete len:123 (+) Transcript_40466:201-569(+)
MDPRRAGMVRRGGCGAKQADEGADVCDVAARRNNGELHVDDVLDAAAVSCCDLARSRPDRSRRGCGHPGGYVAFLLRAIVRRHRILKQGIAEKCRRATVLDNFLQTMRVELYNILALESAIH